MSLRLKWETISSELVADCKVFSVNRNLSFVPGDDGNLGTHDFYVVHPHHWVNVIAITADHEVILVRQFRHGIAGLTLEIPGGMVDPEDPSPLEAASRELLEETGYAASELIHIGRNHPNPAMQSNHCDTFLALNVQKIQNPSFDTTEYIELTLVPLSQISSLILSGKITHALVIAAFHYLQLYESVKSALISQPGK
ncbi:MAG: NUDIX hydrolase [Candidatus Obscuribacterales bacterium]|nr:NUDIX hydrolase [Candidatus Obscuribacterales bacterium]